MTIQNPSLKKWILAVLILSAAMRIGYLSIGDVIPVMWDARRYASAAVAMISYLDDSAPELTSTDKEERERQDRYRFKHYYEKYIQDEQIAWMHYTPHSLTEARDDIFFSGPLYPFLLATAFMISPAADFTVARLLGIVFDLLANYLLILIAVRLIGRRAAIAAGAVYAIYFPFIFSSTLLLLETSTTALMLAAVFCLIRGFEADKVRFFIIGGILTGLLILNKPTAMLLGVPFVLGYLVYARGRHSWSLIINRLLFYFVPLLLIFVSWVAVTSIKYDQLALRDPSYGASNLRQSTSIEFEGYDLDKVEKDFWTRSISDDIISNPLGFATLLNKKFNRLWSRPYNSYQRSFILSAVFTEIFHLFLVIAALIGIVLLLFENIAAAGWPLLIIGYYTSIHLIFHSVSRYNFNAMPLAIICASYFAVKLYDLLSGDISRIRQKSVLISVLLILAWLIDYNWINNLFGVALNLKTVMIVLICKSILLLAALVMIINLILSNRRRMLRRLLACLVLFIIIIPGWTSVLSRDHWAEFSSRLNNQAMVAGTRIFMKKLPEISQDELVALLVDVNSGQGRRNSFNLKINDTNLKLVGGEELLLKYFYPKPAYRIFSAILPIGIEEFRQYAIIPLTSVFINEGLDLNGYLDISLGINSDFPEQNNYINLHGSQSAKSTSQFLPGPRFTAIERFVFKGDPRIRIKANIFSDSTISYYIGRNESYNLSKTDLSGEPGIQNGRYNIFLVHFKPDGSFTVY